MKKMQSLFLNDFYKQKYEALAKEMLGEQDEVDRARDKALRDLATAVEQREFISKKTF